MRFGTERKTGLSDIINGVRLLLQDLVALDLKAITPSGTL